MEEKNLPLPLSMVLIHFFFRKHETHEATTVWEVAIKSRSHSGIDNWLEIQADACPEVCLMGVGVCVKVPYQRIFEVHESPAVQSEPALLEAFRLLRRQTGWQKQSDMRWRETEKAQREEAKPYTDTKQHCTRAKGGVCLAF